MKEVYAKARNIKLLICDVDGVMTDGGLYFGDDGQEYKTFHSREGLGIKMLQRSGVKLSVITARTSEVVTHRMKNLTIKHVYQGQEDKVSAFEQLCRELHLDTEEVAYVGDDVVDLPVMTKVGFAVAVADAHEVVKKHSHWVTEHAGGRGAVRDVCELLMKAQDTFAEQLGFYL